MSVYAATDYSITSANIQTVVTGMHTHLETRDMTTNPVMLIDIIQQDDLMRYTGVIVTQGA